jgi:SAM-dependent methyltransferase
MISNSTQASAVLTESELHTLLFRYRRENWQGIQTLEWQEKIVDDIASDDGEPLLQQVSKFWKIPPRAVVLDVGSGVGSFVVACRRRGMLAFGIEPDRIGRGGSLTSIQIARRRIEEQVFAVGFGEHLPFADASFDLVVLNQVMEHVADQRAVLNEAIRVLKAGGAAYVACPNYLRFREPHYKIFWLPLFPKFLGRLYLRLRRRTPVLLDQLTYTTNGRLRVLFRELDEDCQIVDTHEEDFLNKCADASFARRGARVMAKCMRLPMLGWLIRWAALQYLHITEGGCEMLILRRHTSPNSPC